jgi:quercetin dioxygenase-like cupin family protein
MFQKGMEPKMTKPASKQATGYTPVITALPEAELPFTGVKAWILQGVEQQLIFFEFEPTAKVPEHSHSYPQWGMVIKGKMKLTINGTSRLAQKGDEYLIPAHAKHKATFQTKTRVMDLFQEKTRYKAKTTQ